MNDISLVESSTRLNKTRYTKNPFVEAAVANAKTGTKRLSNKTGDRCMIISETTGEILAPAGFHEILEVDKTQFVKLYLNGVKAFAGLSSPGAKLFEYVYSLIQESPGKDTVYLHFGLIDQEIFKISKSTYERGLTELLNKNFLAYSASPAMFYFNIDFVFNGNRLAFIKEYRLSSNTKPADVKAREALEAQGQQRLDV